MSKFKACMSQMYEPNIHYQTIQSLVIVSTKKEYIFFLHSFLPREAKCGIRPEFFWLKITLFLLKVPCKNIY